MRTHSVRPAKSALFLLASLFLAGCGSSTSAPSGSSSNSGGSASAPNSNPAPSLSAISPQIVNIGSPAVTLSLTGSNFLSTSVVLWNGAALATSFNSNTALTAQVPASNLAIASTAQVTVSTPAPGGGTSSAQTFTIASPSPAPALTAIQPQSAHSGSPAIVVTLSGSNFQTSSVAQWNGQALVTSFVSATTLTAQIPASDLTSSGKYAVTVQTPMPGGGISTAQPFLVEAAGSSAPLTVNIQANSLAWDPNSQQLYLTLPSTSGPNGNSIQALDPLTGTLGASGFAGSEPDLIAVSPTGKYVYTGLDGASSVQRLLLPGLTQDINTPLGADSFDGPYFAGDLQASPAADETVAVVRYVDGTSPAEEGGVVIYDNGTARTDALCGFIQSGCQGKPFGALYDQVQWNADATMMYAINNEDTGFDLYTIPVTSAGFGTVTDYGGVAGGFYANIHFDATTGDVYTDDGRVIDPATGTILGTFNASGIMVPDGKLGVAFFLGQTSGSYGSGTFTIQSFDIRHFTPISSITVPNVVGSPLHMVRWGANGLAFNTVASLSSSGSGQVYIVSGTFVAPTSSASSNAVALQLNPSAANVHRSWPPIHLHPRN